MYPEALSKKKSVDEETIEEQFPVVVNHLYIWPNPRKLLEVAKKAGTKHYSSKTMPSVILAMGEVSSCVFLVSIITNNGAWIPREIFQKNYEKINRKEALRRLVMHGKGGSNGKRG